MADVPGPGIVGFRHTAQVHVATFAALAGELLPFARTVHRVEPGAWNLPGRTERRNAYTPSSPVTL